MKRSLLAFLVVFGLALTLSVSPAQATVLDFGDGGASGGTITYSGGEVVGVGIPVDLLKVIGAPNPVKNGNYDLSGTAPDATGGNGSASLDFSTITDVFSITGDVSGLGVGSQALLTGIIGGWTFSSSGVIGTFNVTSGTDTKSLDLLHAIGYVGDGPFYWAFSGFAIGVELTGANAYEATSVDFANQSVPEPGILILLGIGLSAVGLFSRRIKF
jgi:hypothetical protein